MKKIECIIREDRLKTTLDSLLLAGIPGATVTRVEGFGRQRVQNGPLLKPKVKIDIYLDDEEVDTVIKTIRIAANAGKMGDGKIVILDVEDLFRIRTGESGKEALY